MITPHICQTTDLVILGAGITGLSAAYFLKDRLSVQVIEASDRVGGVIRTSRQGDYLLEHGPDCFMNQKPWALDLALELGLGDRLIKSKDFQRRVFVLRDGQFETTDHQDKAVTEFLGARTPHPNPLHKLEREQQPFLTFRDGMHMLPEALAKALGDRVILNTRITELPKAKRILSTLPAAETATLLGQSWPQFKTTQTTSVYLAYPQDAIDHPLDAFGLIIPASENKKISALTFVSSKFDHRCPPGFILFRVFTKQSPQDARGELEQLFHPKTAPVLEESFTVEYADPKYEPNHLEQVYEIEKLLPPNFFIAGSPYRGVGIADCVYQASEIKHLRF